MSEPTLELQKAVIAKLLQSGPLMALVQDRVFDDVPPGAGFPRITYGDEDIVADDFDCVVSNIVFLPIHIWSNTVGKPQCKEIAGMVRNILHEEELSLDGFALLSLHHDTTRYLRDPDGKTNHGVVTFRAMIDELPLVTEGDGGGDEDEEDENMPRLATRTLSSAELLALFSSPVEIIAAPGANKAINVEVVWATYRFGTTAYTTAGNSNTYLYYNGTVASTDKIVALGFLLEELSSNHVSAASGGPIFSNTEIAQRLLQLIGDSLR